MGYESGPTLFGCELVAPIAGPGFEHVRVRQPGVEVHSIVSRNLQGISCFIVRWVAPCRPQRDCQIVASSSMVGPDKVTSDVCSRICDAQIEISPLPQ